MAKYDRYQTDIDSDIQQSDSEVQQSDNKKKHTQSKKETTKNNLNENDLDSPTYSADRASDKPYTEEKEEAKKETKGKSVDEINAMLVENSEFYDHKSRTEVGFGENLANHAPLRFALNSTASRNINNSHSGRIREYCNASGVRRTLLADMVDTPTENWLNDPSNISNYSIALDNYDYFLKHNKEISINLAKVMLAKLDIDMHSKKTLNDILNDKVWASKSSQEVYFELKNRLRATGKEKFPQYQPIFKILDEANKIEAEYQAYKSEKLRVQKRVIEKKLDRDNPLAIVKDRKLREKIANSIKELSPYLTSTLGNSIDKILDDKEIDKEIKLKASELIKMLEVNSVIKKELYDQNAPALVKNITDAQKAKSEFVATHNDILQKANEATERITFNNDEMPIGILAYLTDKNLYIKKAVAQVLPIGSFGLVL